MSGTLVISFDLDGTLLCGGLPSLEDPDAPPLVSPSGVREDRLRLGARSLLRGLIDKGCRVWIYTESMRGRTPMQEWFATLDITVDGIVNKSIHESAWAEQGFPVRCPRKYPPWFGIDVHVDNDPEVASECAEHGCPIILIDSTEIDFEGAVRGELRRMGVI